MIATPTLADRIEEQRTAREALAKVLAKSLFEEWLKQNAHLLPGDATAEQMADAGFANGEPHKWVQP